MAFTTQEGTGGAPWTFQGTPAADQIAVITGNTGNSVAFDFIAEGFEGDDTINFNGTRSVTIKGGQGADNITNNIAASAGLTSIITTSFINGNDGDDTIGNTQLGLLATLSTVSGGQGADKIYGGQLQTSKLNGNLGNDFLSIGVVTDDIAPELDNLANFNAASIFGGQGNDAIRVKSSVAFTNSQVNGQLGDDVIQIELGSFNFTAATVTPFDPTNGVTDIPTGGSVFFGGDGNDILDASGLLIDIRSSGRVEIDSRGRNAASGADLDLRGDDGDDSIFGGVGEDFIEGNADDDWIAGGGGRDEVFGGTGDDVVIGAYFDGELSVGTIGDGAGDFLAGGTGSNRFYVPGTRAPRAIAGGGLATNGVGSTGDITVVDAELVSSPNTAVISNGDLITVAFGADVITDWTSGAGSNVLDTGIGNNIEVGATGTTPDQMSLGQTYNGGANNYAVRGFYTERFNEVGQFVVNSQGTDIAVWTNYNGTQFNNSINGTFSSSVNNFTILKNVGQSVVLTANQFVAV